MPQIACTRTSQLSSRNSFSQFYDAPVWYAMKSARCGTMIALAAGQFRTAVGGWWTCLRDPPTRRVSAAVADDLGGSLPQPSSLIIHLSLSVYIGFQLGS
jgi:hypothetical protein